MTRFLASVATADEAAAALAAGAEVIDAKDPATGALGALAPETVAAIAAVVAGRAELSAAGGDAPTEAGLVALAAAGAVYVKVPVTGGEAGAAALARFGRIDLKGARRIAVFAADAEPDLELVPVAALAGFDGVMLDTRAKSAGLLSVMELADIARFVAAGKRAGLMVGLAGSLKVVDVGTLLPLRADLLGFRGALVAGGDRAGAISPAAVRAVATAFRIHALPRGA